MGRFRQRVFGSACLALVVINATAVLCGGMPGSDTRMPCCLTLERDSRLPTIEPCCAAEQRQQADPAGVATTLASTAQLVHASTPLPEHTTPPPYDLPLIRDLDRRIVGPPPDTHLLLSVFLI
jgi:hypothetical protein